MAVLDPQGSPLAVSDYTEILVVWARTGELLRDLGKTRQIMDPFVTVSERVALDRFLDILREQYTNAEEVIVRLRD